MPIIDSNGTQMGSHKAKLRLDSPTNIMVEAAQRHIEFGSGVGFFSMVAHLCCVAVRSKAEPDLARQSRYARPMNFNAMQLQAPEYIPDSIFGAYFFGAIYAPRTTAGLSSLVVYSDYLVGYRKPKDGKGGKPPFTPPGFSSGSSSIPVAPNGRAFPEAGTSVNLCSVDSIERYSDSDLVAAINLYLDCIGWRGSRHDLLVAMKSRRSQLFARNVPLDVFKLANMDERAIFDRISRVRKT